MGFSDSKYIITKGGSAVIFSCEMKHSEFKHLDPISAGFVSFSNVDGCTRCVCYDSSVSLGLKSREVDSDIIQNKILKFIL